MFVFRNWLILILLLVGKSSLAQNSAALFEVVHLPRKAGISKTVLNEQIKNCKTKAEVLKALQRNNTGNAAITMRILKPNGAISWWTANSQLGNMKEDRIILQSKNIYSQKIYQLNDFKAFFNDTLILFDSLPLRFYLQDEGYSGDGFMLASTCAGNAAYTTAIPFDGFLLVFSKKLLGHCDQLAKIELYHRNNPQRSLANGSLGFFSEEQLETLTSIVNYYLQNDTTLTDNQLAEAITNYCMNNYGRPYYPQLISWIKKTKNK